MRFIMILALLAAFLSAFGQTKDASGREMAVDRDGYFNTSVDPWDPGGFKDEYLSDPKLAGGDKVVVSFPFKMRLTMWFKDAKTGKTYQRTAWLRPDEPIVGNVKKRVYNEKTRRWELLCEAWLAANCANPFPRPFQFTAEVPEITRDRVRVQFLNVAIVKPEAFEIPLDVYVREEIPSPRDITIELPERERPGYELVLHEELRAKRYWRYAKDFWDHVLGLLKAVAFPVGMLVRKADSISVSASASAASAASASAAATAAQSQAQGQQQGGGGLMAWLSSLSHLSAWQFASTGEAG